MIRKVSFDSSGVALVGNLYLPAGATGSNPAVVVTGSWTSVKEQNPAEYARRLAERGFAVLAFDHTGFGESGGAIRGYENPAAKVADIKAAISFLENLPEIDRTRINGLGICAGGGYMARVAAEEPRLNAVATVAGWYTDAALYREFFTPAGYAALDQAGKAGRQAFETSGTVVTRPAVSDGSTPAAMAVQPAVDYYAGRARVPGWTETWPDLSYQAILAFETIPSAANISIPALVVHAENAISPGAAYRHFRAIGASEKELVWMGDVNQFQFYDDPAVVDAAVVRVADWFAKH
ncbi:hypothetical protein LCM4573_04380 [Rhizobium sp. LCM 4573]|nr:hypothetical protein LCM4573_04380 [Rhizobium sp. LCM 4573]